MAAGRRGVTVCVTVGVEVVVGGVDEPCCRNPSGGVRQVTQRATVARAGCKVVDATACDQRHAWVLTASSAFRRTKTRLESVRLCGIARSRFCAVKQGMVKCTYTTARHVCRGASQGLQADVLFCSRFPHAGIFSPAPATTRALSPPWPTSESINQQQQHSSFIEFSNKGR